MKKKIEVDVEIPMTPNFIQVAKNPYQVVPVQDFTDEELQEIGEEWTRKLIEKANTRRNNKQEL